MTVNATALMSLVNEIDKVKTLSKADYKTLITLLNPFAPHITEELWEIMGFEGLCSLAEWSSYDEEKCKDSEIEIAVQVNGKLRARVNIPAEATQDEVLEIAKADEKVAGELAKGTVVKEIYIKGKLVNIVIRPNK